MYGQHIMQVSSGILVESITLKVFLLLVRKKLIKHLLMSIRFKGALKILQGNVYTAIFGI